MPTNHAAHLPPLPDLGGPAQPLLSSGQAPADVVRRHPDSPVAWAALAAALDVSLGRPDYAVDHAGWRPKSKLMTGPARPGILGVLQAQHNLVAVRK